MKRFRDNENRDNLSLRIPWLGPVTVDRILTLRTGGNRVHRLGEIGRVGKLLLRAEPCLKFG